MRRLVLVVVAFAPLWGWAQAKPQVPVPEEETEKSSDPLDALADAEPISWKAGVSKADLALAEPFIVSVEITHPKSVTYDLRPGLDLEPFGIAEKKLETTQTDPAVTTLRLKLQPFKTGELAVPRLRFLVEGEDGTRKFDVPPQHVQVTGVIDPGQESPQMREDLRPLPTRHVTRWWPLIVLVAVLLGGFLAWLWRRRKARGPALVPEKPREPPDVEAFARLAALEAEQLVAKGRHQEYYFRLSETARDYFGRLYGFDALEMTTDELLDELRTRSTRGLDFDALTAFFRAGDLVKFARREPSDGEAKSAADEVRVFIERTRPRPEPVGRAS